jgi:hypothetical protein
MSFFDQTGGPFNYVIKIKRGADWGFDIFIKSGTFTDQTEDNLVGSIKDYSLYIGKHSDRDNFIARVNWFNQGAMERANKANFIEFPNLQSINYNNLLNIGFTIPELAIINLNVDGLIDITPYFDALSLPIISRNRNLKVALLATISSLAHNAERRVLVNTRLGLTGKQASIFLNYGVLTDNHLGAFTDNDLDCIEDVLKILPVNILNQLHVILFNSALPVAGGYSSGGIIDLNNSSGALSSIVPLPISLRTRPSIDFFSGLLIHEIGHLIDSYSVSFEADRYEAIFTAALSDPRAFMYHFAFDTERIVSEEIIFFWNWYIIDSQSLLEEATFRDNIHFNKKISHVIDLIAHPERNKTYWFTVNTATHKIERSTVDVVRNPSTVLGDDGDIRTVNGFNLL